MWGQAVGCQEPRGALTTTMPPPSVRACHLPERTLVGGLREGDPNCQEWLETGSAQRLTVQRAHTTNLSIGSSTVQDASLGKQERKQLATCTSKGSYPKGFRRHTPVGWPLYFSPKQPWQYHGAVEGETEASPLRSGLSQLS